MMWGSRCMLGKSITDLLIDQLRPFLERNQCWTKLPLKSNGGLAKLGFYSKKSHGWTDALCRPAETCTLRWRHNGCDSVSNHQPRECLLRRLIRRTSKKTSKLRRPVNSPHKWPVTRKNVSIWWRHHDFLLSRNKRATVIPIGIARLVIRNTTEVGSCPWELKAGIKLVIIFVNVCFD